ncbi:MAG: hypothetical protein C4308_10765 [Chitinophagaceae bacterium]
MWVASAAAVLLICMLIWKPWAEQDIFKQFADTQMPVVDERGQPSDSLLKKVSTAFNEKNYFAAVPVFEQLLKTDSSASTLFYYSIAILQTGNTNKAREELQKIYNGNSIYKYDAAFYLALSYVKDKNNEKAKEWLNRIPSGSPVYEKATQLKNKL